MKKKHLLQVTMAAIASLALSSCLPDEGDSTEIRPGFVSIVNAVPDTNALDFYLQGQQVPNEGSSVSYMSRWPESSYATLQPFTLTFEATEPGGSNALIRSGLTAPEDEYVSVYIYKDSAEGDVVGLMVLDSLDNVPSGMARVKFLHFGTGADPVDVISEGEETPWFDGYEFEDEDGQKSYKLIPAGSYMVDVLDDASADTLTNTTVDLEGGKVYTLWLGGYAGRDDEKGLYLNSIEHEPVEGAAP